MGSFLHLHEEPEAFPYVANSLSGTYLPLNPFYRFALWAGAGVAATEAGGSCILRALYSATR